MIHRNHRGRRHSQKRGPATSPPRNARQRSARSKSARSSLIAERKGGPFLAPDIWHEPQGRDHVQILAHTPGAGYIHPVSPQEVADRIEQLPARFRDPLEVVQLSRMTRKRSLFPCYGLQWGTTVYLYPIEETLVETYRRPPRPAQRVEAQMFGGCWVQDGDWWRLEWTEAAIKDFYLNNILIHEIGHVCDARNTNARDRERFAEWFAIEYGYRASRSRR